MLCIVFHRYADFFFLAFFLFFCWQNTFCEHHIFFFAYSNYHNCAFKFIINGICTLVDVFLLCVCQHCNLMALIMLAWKLHLMHNQHSFVRLELRGRTLWLFASGVRVCVSAASNLCNLNFTELHFSSVYMQIDKWVQHKRKIFVHLSHAQMRLFFDAKMRTRLVVLLFSFHFNSRAFRSASIACQLFPVSNCFSPSFFLDGQSNGFLYYIVALKFAWRTCPNETNAQFPIRFAIIQQQMLLIIL